MKPGKDTTEDWLDRECPRCDSSAYRVPRRFVDVLRGLFGAVRRYRCTAMGCGWEGNLRPPRH